jgi:hypothetical protein
MEAVRSSVTSVILFHIALGSALDVDGSSLARDERNQGVETCKQGGERERARARARAREAMYNCAQVCSSNCMTYGGHESIRTGLLPTIVYKCNDRNRQ